MRLENIASMYDDFWRKIVTRGLKNSIVILSVDGKWFVCTPMTENRN